MKTLFAIIDLETTGGSARLDKITEIAIVLHDGVQIVDQFSTLIYPERSIPYHITHITGIDDEMVADAPRFYEVAKRVVQMTEQAIFVAHNVRFDYGFLREEFARLGFTYTRQQLCTIQLTRKAFPGLSSYSLGNLIRTFGIPVKNRHRALDDALATAQLFEYILARQGVDAVQKQFLQSTLRATRYPRQIAMDKIEALPEGCGVYYMYNASGELVYIGKSIHIRQRIREHFTDQTEKAAKLQSMVADISAELTGSELISIIKEDLEIRKLKPEINKAQRKTSFPVTIYLERQPGALPRILAAELPPKKLGTIHILSQTTTLSEARSRIEFAYQQHGICACLQDYGVVQDACLQRKLGFCESPHESITEEHLEPVIRHLSRIFQGSFLIVERGRTADEKAVILIREGALTGYGYLHEDSPYEYEGDLQQYTPTPQATRELEIRISQYIQKNEGRLRLIPLAGPESDF